MPIALHVIRASEFVCLDTDEHLDFEASKKALQGLAHACRKRGLDRAMLDLRGLPVLPRPHFTPTQLAALVGTFREAGFTRQQRLAVLYQHDVHGGIRNFTFFSRMRGMHVQAFRDFERAMFWLSEDHNPDDLGPAVPIPIVKREPKKKPAGLTAGISHPHVHRPIISRTTKTKST